MRLPSFLEQHAQALTRSMPEREAREVFARAKELAKHPVLGFDYLMDRLAQEPAQAAALVLGVIAEKHPNEVAALARQATCMADVFAKLASSTLEEAAGTFRGGDPRDHFAAPSEERGAAAPARLTRIDQDAITFDVAGSAVALDPSTLSKQPHAFLDAAAQELRRAAPESTDCPILGKVRTDRDAVIGALRPLLLRHVDAELAKRDAHASTTRTAIDAALRVTLGEGAVGRADKAAVDAIGDLVARLPNLEPPPTLAQFEDWLRDGVKVPITEAARTAIAQASAGVAPLRLRSVIFDQQNMSLTARAHLLAHVAIARRPDLFADYDDALPERRFQRALDDGELKDVLEAMHRELFTPVREGFAGKGIDLRAVEHERLSFDVDGFAKPLTISRHSMLGVDAWIYKLAGDEGSVDTLSASSLRNILAALTSVSSTSASDGVVKVLRERLEASEGHVASDLQAHVAKVLARKLAKSPDDERVAKAVEDAPKRPHTVGQSLIDTSLARWYQRSVFDTLRAEPRPYDARVVSSGTGSGKTMMAMMCVEDWLQSLRKGAMIVYAVPTPELQGQLADQLCVHHNGLRLRTNDVFVGTPSELQIHLASCKRRGASPPKVAVFSHDGLRFAARKGTEKLFGALGVEHVVIDEMHHLVQDKKSRGWDAAKELREMLGAGKLKSLVGFSATIKDRQEALRALGYELAVDLPEALLSASGAIAPYVHLGLVYGQTDSESTIEQARGQVRDLVKTAIAGFNFRHIAQQHSQHVIDWLTWLNGKSDVATAQRVLKFASGTAPAALTDIDVITACALTMRTLNLGIQQDAALQEKRAQWAKDLGRHPLAKKIAPPTKDFDQDRQELGDADSEARRTLVARHSVYGLLWAMQQWGRRAGEARGQAIREILEAQREVYGRAGSVSEDNPLVSLVFDEAARIKKAKGTVDVGSRGVAATLGTLLSDEPTSTVAVMAHEIYFPTESDIRGRTCAEIERRVIDGPAVREIVAALTDGLELLPGQRHDLQRALTQSVQTWVKDVSAASLTDPNPKVKALAEHLASDVRSGTYGTFDVAVRGPLLHSIERLTESLRPQGLAVVHWTRLLRCLKHPTVVTIRTANGRTHDIDVVEFPPHGPIRQLVTRIAAALIDTPKLGVRTMVVSDWAYEGFDTRRPQVVVNACHPRSETQFRQIAGRAQRPSMEWTNELSELVFDLIGFPGLGETPARAAAGELTRRQCGFLKDAWERAHPETPPPAWLAEGDMSRVPAVERHALVQHLMLTFNKVPSYIQLLQFRGGHRADDIVRSVDSGLARKPELEEQLQRQVGVDPDSGRHVRGAAQAPLVNPDGKPFKSAKADVALFANRLRNVVQAQIDAALHKGGES